MTTANGSPAEADGVIGYVEAGSNVGDASVGETDGTGAFELAVPDGDTVDIQYYQNFPSADHDIAFPEDGSPDVYALARVRRRPRGKRDGTQKRHPG